MASRKLDAEIHELEQELENIPIPDAISAPLLMDDFEFDEKYYDDVIKGHIRRNGRASSRIDEGWEIVEAIARQKMDLRIQSEADRKSTLMGVYRKNVAFLEKSLDSVIATLDITSDKILKLRVPGRRKIENWLTAMLFLWIFLGATYFFYTLWTNTFLPSLQGVERLAPLLLCGLLIVPADILSKLYYKHPEYQKQIGSAAFWGTLVSVGLMLVLFGVARGLGEISAGLIQAENVRMGQLRTDGSALALSAIDQGVGIPDWLRICIYSLLPIGEMFSATYLLIFIREVSGKSAEEQQLSDLRAKQRKLNRYKAAIEHRMPQLCEGISRGERFEELKAIYIDYNLKLIEAHYRSRFEAADEERRRAENGRAQIEDAQISEKEEELMLWSAGVKLHDGLHMKDTGYSDSLPADESDDAPTE